MTEVLSFPDRCYVGPINNLVPQDSLAMRGLTRELSGRRVLCGLHLPFLPDFLADPTLVGQTDADRLGEILERQVQFITNLWKWQSAAFSLRFIYHPAHAGVEVALLARVLCLEGQEQAASQQLSLDLRRILETFGLTPREVSSTIDLNRLRAPIAQPRLVEVRQREEIVYFPWARADAYVVYPYWEPTGAFLQPLEALLRHGEPAAINLHLEPTQLAASEYEAVVKAAAIAQTAADWQRSAHSVEYSGRWSDPQAANAARVYASQLRRLAQPFVMVAQVASHDEFVAMSIAQTLGAAFTARSAGRSSRDDELTSGFDIVYPRTEAHAQAAARTLHHLVLTPWGDSGSTESPELVRLRYLADARGAAALFRLPVAVRSGVPGIEVRQPMPDFEPGKRRTQVQADEIHLGSYQRGGAVTLHIDDLTRHVLVAGLPGGGKTNTCLYLLSQLHERHIPFLVVEPAKTEYRGLIRQFGFTDVLVFTLGDETTAPFRLNPFELLPGVRLEVHLEALNVAINAALPQFGVLPTIIEEALEEVYRARGWRLTDRGSEGDQRLFPTMAEFYGEAVRVVEQRGYRGELHDNITAAVKGRLGSLLRGSKGRMFNCRRSLSLQMLLNNPVVLELDSLSDDVKSLTMMFLLILIREYRQMQMRTRGEQAHGLQHVLLIEEAHRVMENVTSVANPEVSADTRARAVRTLTDFLVEMRSYGQGIIIAEQSPEKLAADAVRNTNLKISHMLPGRQDRDALAAAMILDEAQERFVGKLRVGQAAVFATGFEKATFMTVPNFKGHVQFADFLPDDAIHTHMARYYTDNRLALLPFDGCRYCSQACQHREWIEPITRRKELAGQFQTALQAFDTHPEPEHWPANWRGIADVCTRAAGTVGRTHSMEAAYCYLAHEIDFPFTEHMRRSFVRAVEALPASG